MRSLAGIRARLDELLAARAVENEPPACIVLLPECHRGPPSDAPYPRVHRVGRTAIIVFLGEEQPTREEIAQLLAVQP